MHTSYVPHVSEQEGWDTFYILLEQNNTLGQEEENLGHVIKVDCVNSTGKKLDYLNSWTFGENVLKTNLL